MTPAVTGAGPAAVLAGDGAGGSGTPSPAPAGLMPSPDVSGLSGSDPMSMLYLLESREQQQGVQAGTAHVQNLEAERTKALQDEQAAIQHAVDAAQHHEFWANLGSVCGEVAKAAAVVASVAAAVATCGAAAPLAAIAVAGAVLSAAGFADGELHVLHTLGVDDQTAGSVDLGLSLGGAACSMGAGIAAGGQTASATTSAVARGSAIVAGAATMGEGASAIAAGEALAQQDGAAADEVAAQARSQGLLRAVQQAIATLGGSDKQSTEILQTVADIKTTQDQSIVASAIAVKG